MRLSILAKSGVLFLLTGILVTEVILIGNGLLAIIEVPVINGHPWLLALFSLLMLLGIALVFFDQFRKPLRAKPLNFTKN